MQSQLTIQHRSSSGEMQTRCGRQSRFADTAPHPVSGTRQGRGGHPQRRVGQGSVSDSLGPEDKKETEAAEKINDLRYCCVQDEDTRFEMFCFGLFCFVVVMFYINN